MKLLLAEELLLAEDEPAMSEAVTDILEYHRYQVDAVYDGIEALDYIHAGNYDGLILDIMMPGMSGLEVLKKIRQEGVRTPVLLLTARSEIEDRIEGLDAGADDYLPKPFARTAVRRQEDRAPQSGVPDDGSPDAQSRDLSLFRGSSRKGLGVRHGGGCRSGMGLHFLSEKAHPGGRISGEDHGEKKHRLYADILNGSRRQNMEIRILVW